MGREDPFDWGHSLIVTFYRNPDIVYIYMWVVIIRICKILFDLLKFLKIKLINKFPSRIMRAKDKESDDRISLYERAIAGKRRLQEFCSRNVICTDIIEKWLNLVTDFISRWKAKYIFLKTALTAIFWIKYLHCSSQSLRITVAARVTLEEEGRVAKGEKEREVSGDC